MKKKNLVQDLTEIKDGNETEVEQVRRIIEQDVVFRGVKLYHFEKSQGWLTGEIFSSSMHESVKFFVEFPSGYPQYEPPNILFPKNKTLLSLSKNVRNAARVFQKNNKTRNGRCLEDCLAYIAKALEHVNIHENVVVPPQTPSSILLGLVGNNNSIGGGLNALGGGNTTSGLNTASSSYSDLSWSVRAFENSNSNHQRDQTPRNSQISLLKSFGEGWDGFSEYNSSPSTIILSTDNLSSSNLNIPSKQQESRDFHIKEDAIPSHKNFEHAKCGVSFGGKDLIAVFTSSSSTAINSKLSSSKIMMDKQNPQRIFWDDFTNKQEDISESKEISRVSVLHLSSTQSFDCAYRLNCPDNHLKTRSESARLAWSVLETCPENVLTIQALKFAFSDLIKENDIATLAMLSARAKFAHPTKTIPLNEIQMKRYCHAYLEQLQRSGEFTRRCELNKIVKDQSHDYLEVKWLCLPDQTHACSLCRLSVTGLVSFCFRCNHGGHSFCLLKWFENEEICPTGCGCKCAILRVL